MPKKQRITPSLGVEPTLGRPGAVTRDVFVPRQGEAAGAPLRDLARSLSRFGEQAGRLAPVLREQQQDKQAREGRAAFLADLEEQKDMTEALRKLEMRPQQSKWFRFGALAEAGKQDALLARDHFVATRGDQLLQARTLEEFDKLASEALDEYMGDRKNSEAFDNGFFPSYLAQMEAQRFSFAQGLDSKLTSDYIDKWRTRITGELQAHLDRGMGLEGVGEWLTTQLDATFEDNPQMYSDVKAELMVVLRTVAERDINTAFSVLDAAEEIFTGKQQGEGLRPTMAAEFLVQLNEAKKSVVGMVKQRDKDARDLLARNEAEEAKGLLSDTLALVADGGRSTPEGAAAIATNMARLVMLNPTAAGTMITLVESTESFADNTIRGVYDGLLTDIWNGNGSTSAIIANFSRLSTTDVHRLQGELAEFESLNEGENKALFDLDPINKWRQLLKGRFEKDGILAQDAATRHRNAIGWFNRELVKNKAVIEQHLRDDPTGSSLEDIMSNFHDVAFRHAASPQEREMAGIGSEQATGTLTAGGPEAPREWAPADIGEAFGHVNGPLDVMFGPNVDLNNPSDEVKLALDDLKLVTNLPVDSDAWWALMIRAANMADSQ